MNIWQQLTQFQWMILNQLVSPNALQKYAIYPPESFLRSRTKCLVRGSLQRHFNTMRAGEQIGTVCCEGRKASGHTAITSAGVRATVINRDVALTHFPNCVVD